MTSPLPDFDFGPDFGGFVATYEAVVCATAYAVLRDRARSEEIAQEAFLVAWQKLPGMSSAPSMPGWVCGIARNLARNAARRRKEMPMDASTPEPATTTPLDELIDRERMEVANRALERLSEVEREAIVVYYRGDESLGSVARALGISEAAAKKRVLRGRDHLRAAVADVELTLRATRPSTAFRTGCIAAASAAGLAIHDRAAGAAVARGATVRAKPHLAWLAVAVISIPVIGTAVWGAPKLFDHAAASPTTAAVISQAQPRPAAMTTLTRHVDPDRKQALVAQIAAARTARTRMAPSSPPAHDHDRVFDFSGSPLMQALPEPIPHSGALDKHALRDAIRSVQPLIRECYEKLGKGATGSLDLVVRLESEPDIGTIATDARVDGAFASNAELVECVRESLLSIEMPDLVDPGITDVYYPFAI